VLKRFDPRYQRARFTALPDLDGYRDRTQRTLLGDGCIATYCDSVPGLHTAAQGVQCIFTFNKLRSGRRALGVRGAVEREGKYRIRVDVEVLSLDTVDEVVFLNVCE
jgi:hypothetical protein